jgi:pyrophosphatase PpaX
VSRADAASSGYDPVLFDLDGTLIDSVALIRESHRHAVRTVLGADLPDEVLVANVGRPLIDQMRAFDPARAEELLRVYREWNHANTAGILRAFPGLDDVLERLGEAGRRMAVVTSKSHPTVDLALDVLPIRHHFAAVVAAEDTTRHKPDPEPVLHALDLLGAPAAGACYAGDAPFDIRSGRAAGVTTIAVTWAFFSRAALVEAGPDLVVETPAELLAACLGA